MAGLSVVNPNLQATRSRGTKISARCSCGGWRRSTPPRRAGASQSGCRFCVLHGSAREDDEDGYDGDDDYLPMLDPLVWSVRYEACPRDVCVTRGLRAALCDPD